MDWTVGLVWRRGNRQDSRIASDLQLDRFCTAHNHFRQWTVCFCAAEQQMRKGEDTVKRNQKQRQILFPFRHHSLLLKGYYCIAFLTPRFCASHLSYFSVFLSFMSLSILLCYLPSLSNGFLLMFIHSDVLFPLSFC